MKKTKLILTTLIIMLAAILLNTIEVQATLQANGKTSVTRSADKWISEFRNMEKQGEGMGLSETVNADLTAKSASNNIDVHMAKSTEFGAMLILTASAYGNPSNVSSISTSTGNNTGVKFNYYNENVAATTDGTFLSAFDSKYFDRYSSNVEYYAKIGDAIGTKTSLNPGCNGWHKSYSCSNLTKNILRGGTKNGIFTVGSNNGYDRYANEVSYSRGVAVCGEGL